MAAFLGKVNSIDGDTARVIPLSHDDLVTLPFAMHWQLRDNLKAGEEVACIQFDDGSGVILCRANGNKE